MKFLIFPLGLFNFHYHRIALQQCTNTTNVQHNRLSVTRVSLKSVWGAVTPTICTHSCLSVCVLVRVFRVCKIDRYTTKMIILQANRALFSHFFMCYIRRTTTTTRDSSCNLLSRLHTHRSKKGSFLFKFC